MSNIIQTKEVISSISKATQEQILKNLRYDRTVEATIHYVEDASLGEYRVRYQDAIFKAESIDPNIKYYKGDLVLVKIPEGDFSSSNKTITGLVNKRAAYYIESDSGSSSLYNIIGQNLYNGEDIVLSSDTPLENRDVSFKDKLIAEDERNLYLQDATHLLLKFKLQTNVPENQLKGYYAIGLDLKFSKEVEVEDGAEDLDEEETAGVTTVAEEEEEDDETTYSSESKVETVEFIESYYFDPLNVNGYSLYNLNIPTKQSLLFTLPQYSDSRKFLGVENAVAYVRDFNPGAGVNKDIHFKDIEILAIGELPSGETQNGYLIITTPKGAYFPYEKKDKATDKEKEELPLKAKFFLNGELVNAKKQDLKFYWFKEDLETTPDSNYYMKEAGSGWACLNKRTGKNKSKENIFKPETQDYKLPKSVCFLESRNIKCIVKIKDKDKNKNIFVSSKPITVYNKDSVWSLNITSSKGIKDKNKNAYAIPRGVETVLKCVIKIKSTSDGKVTYINPDTKKYKIKYNWQYSENNGSFHPVSASDIVKDSEGQKIKISKAIQSRTYTCGVSIHDTDNKDEDYEMAGTASIDIYEGTGKTSGYSILIENDSQSFVYDGNGGAPDEPLPLKLKFFNNGLLMENEEDIAAAIDEGKDRVLWKIPIEDTLLVSPSTKAKNKNGYHKLYRNFKKEFSFTVDDEYKLKHTKNQIIAQVKMKGTLVTAKTSFSFVKQGAMGTNGTDESCWIEYKTKKGTFVKTGEFLQIENRKYNENKAEEEKQEEQENKVIVRGSMDSGQWSAYGSKGTKTNLNIVSKDSRETAIKYKSNSWLDDKGALQPISNILKYTCSLGAYRCHYYLPIVIIKYLDKTWKSSGNIALKKGTGFSSVMYSSDGKNPLYNKEAPFELSIKKPSKDFKYKVDWVGFSSSEFGGTQYSFTITPNKKTTRKVKVVPPKLYNHYSQVFYLLATVRAASNASTVYARVLIPIYCYTNSFFNSDINEWSGGSVQVNDSSILAPMVGAGFKDLNNKFTGVVIGTQKDSDGIDTGLFAYGNGTRTVFVDAKTGKAEFGASGGSIKIKPGESPMITSDVYTTGEKGSGMQINFGTTPSIKFGSQKFMVNAAGELTAKGGGKIAGWSIGEKELSNGDRTGMCAAFHRFKKKNEEETTNSETDALNKEGNLKTDYETNPNAEVVKLKINGEEKYIAKAFWAGSKKEEDGASNKSKFLVTHEGFLKAEECMLGSGANKVYIDCHSSGKAIHTGGEINCKAIHADGKIRCKDLYFPVKTEVGKDKDGNPIYELVDTSLVSILNKIPGVDIKQSL